MKPGRNDPCPCGSGQKYKLCCHGKAAPPAGGPARQPSGPPARGKRPTDADLDRILALMNSGRFEELENWARLLVEQYPKSGDIWKALGVALFLQGKDALHVNEKVTKLLPGDAEAHCNLGIALIAAGRYDAAVASFRRALKIKPDYHMAHSNLGLALQSVGQLDDAIASYRRALGINSDDALLHSNLGCTLQSLGQLDVAMACYRRALEIKPDFAIAHSNLIFAMDLTDTYGLPELHAERKMWDAAHAAPLWQKPVHANDRAPDRRLRIGYVSADFREHSATKVFGGMLTRYDSSHFDVFAYSNFNGKSDRFTDLFKQGVTAWREIGRLPDDAVATLIREDQIDILVDLSGHSGGNCLQVFARKPAPIQITAWGYATGTGMRAMDVFFTDPVMVPPEEKPFFTEDIRYLPCACCAFFTEPFPDVNELPALTDGIVTFGSLNRLVKVSEKAYHAWAQVLLAVPRSRLMLKTAELDDVSARQRVAGYFAKAGVAADRIVMQGKTSWHEHMQVYNRIDLALDPFPHGGGVTALEGLMMGVPMVTLRWPTTAGRLSASIMTTLGLTGWIAETQEEYVGLAVRKANDLQGLAALRGQLRERFTSSDMGDPEAYARAVEREYRGVWQEWCAKDQGA